MPRSVTSNSVIYTHSLSLTRSFSGKLGMSSRWRGHKKKNTKLIRIYEDDYNSISRLLPLDDSINSFASFFHSASSFYLCSSRFSPNSTSKNH